VITIYASGKKTSGRFRELTNLATSHNISVERVSEGKLGGLARVDHHQGVCARVGPYPLVTVSQIFDAIDRGGRVPRILLLDHITDPQNLGAILRTALCIDTDGVLVTKDRSASPTPAVSRASAGAMEHIRLGRVTNSVAAIKTLKQKGLWVIGLDGGAPASIYSADFTCPHVLVIGGEEKGIRPLVKKHCDSLVSIPQNRAVDSLNASVAAAVAMYEAFRQRQA